MKIMEAYAIEYPTSADVKAVSNFEFFKNDTINFVNTGFRVIMDLNGYSAINDSFRFFYFGPIELVEISRQDPQKVFISDLSATFRSFDGGNTFPQDSILLNGNFSFLSLCDFDDTNWFGLNEEGELVKTNAGTVDTSKIIYDRYLNFYYDINQFHVYRVNKTYGGYSLNVSNNKGNAFSWTKTYLSENPIFISIDSTQSGVVYLADGKQVYKSTNNGYNFYPYKSLPSKLVGIYKKLNSEILYAASKNKIFKVTPDSVLVIKSLPIPEDVFSFYPLSVGNYWVYNVFDWSYPYYSHYIYTRKVVSKEILSNSKEYFVIEETENNYPAIFTVYERVDSINGKILRYAENCSTPDNEIVIEDFMAEVGDSILVRRFSHCSDILSLFEQEGMMDVFSQVKNYRNFIYDYLQSLDYKLVQDFGLYSISVSYDFGNTGYTLKGCIINGNVYGDTTLTDVDDELNSLPTEYNLDQNYPNPFNPSTVISYQLPISGNVTLKIFDALGREVATLVDEYKNAGSYNIEFDASILPSGVYFYQLQAGSFVQTRKMVLLQ
jgi:hypothetical protein